MSQWREIPSAPRGEKGSLMLSQSQEPEICHLCMQPLRPSDAVAREEDGSTVHWHCYRQHLNPSNWAPRTA